MSRPIDRRALLLDKFDKALHGERPKENNPELSPRTPLVFTIERRPRQRFYNDLPRSAYGAPKDYTPTHGGKRSTMRFREDWNVDGSGWAELHDAAAGAVDIETLATALRFAGEKKLARRALATGAAILSEEFVGGDSERSERKWTPTTTRRELQQRLSRKQRRILECYKLWLTGLTWRQVAKEMGETERTVYGWQLKIRSLLGRAITTRENCQPRDQNNRFVGCSKTVKR